MVSKNRPRNTGPQKIPADMIGADAVEVGQHQSVSEEDRVIEEGLRRHQTQTDQRAWDCRPCLPLTCAVITDPWPARPAAVRCGQGLVITSHRPEPNIEIARENTRGGRGRARRRHGGGVLSIARPCATAIACQGLRSAECSQPQPRSSARAVPAPAVQARPPSRGRASTIRLSTRASTSRRPAAIPAAPPPMMH